MKTYTIQGRDDGFGGQYQAVMAAIAYCDYNNYKYIHTPFIKMGHDVSVEEMNHFTGIPSTEEKNVIIDVIEAWPKDVHLSRSPDIYYTDKVIQKLRNYYYSTHKPDIDTNDIAIHIRRGDVDAVNNSDRYIPNIFYKHLITSLKKIYPSYKIVIHSEGKISDFDDLISDNVYFKLNEDVRKTFHAMVTSNVLVTSISSLSYSAAILNTNTIFYVPFMHAPLRKWNIL